MFFMQYKQMQHTFTWLKKYSATKANGTHLSIVIIISHNTRQLAGTEGRAEARPRMLWEPPFPSSVQLIHLSVSLFLSSCSSLFPTHSYFQKPRPSHGQTESSMLLPTRLGQDSDLADAPHVCTAPPSSQQLVAFLL